MCESLCCAQGIIFWIMGLMGQVSLLVTRSLVMYPCFSCVAGSKSQPDALIEPKKPKLHIAVQECQEAEMSKRNILTFPNRTFSDLSDKKISGKGSGMCQLWFGVNQADFRAAEISVGQIQAGFSHYGRTLQFEAGFEGLCVSWAAWFPSSALPLVFGEPLPEHPL